MPDGCKDISNIALVNLFNRYFSQLRQNVELQWREPPASLPISPKLGLSCLKCFLAYCTQRIVSPLQLALFFSALFDRIRSANNGSAPLVSKFTGLFQRNVVETAQPHFPPASVNSRSKYPLRTAIRSDVKPKVFAIAVFTWHRMTDESR